MSFAEWFIITFIVPLASIVALTFILLRPDALEDC